MDDDTQEITPPTLSLPLTTMPEGMFQDAHNFSITGAQFIENFHQVRTNGIRILLEASIPGAFHDSSARDPPPRCHPGTRRGYIEKLSRWSSRDDPRSHRILWMRGPAGVGKSAVAQSFAEELGDKLGAAFFFSEYNQRNDPNRFFTSISYQLAAKFDSYRNILDQKVDRDPTLVEKSPTSQFQDLIATPLREMKDRGENIGHPVIIVDGLDECASGTAQCDFVNIVATSVRARTTPFLWAFFSRPEPHIYATFTSPGTSRLSMFIELPVSREIDNEIAMYLTDKLRKIGREHNLGRFWPHKQDVQALVIRSAGLFVYATSVVRFVSEPNSSGPQDQLRSVLALPGTVLDSSTHPLSDLDVFYTLIMQRIPSKILPTTQKILLATTFSRIGNRIIDNANLLGLTQSQFRNASRGLHSVLELGGEKIRFYHASFMEFLQDPARSGKYHIRSDCAVSLRSELLEKLNRVHANSSSGLIQIPITWPQYNYLVAYRDTVGAFFNLCESVPLDDRTIDGLSKFDFAKLLSLSGSSTSHEDELHANILLQNIPRQHQSRIIRQYAYLRFEQFLSGQFKRPLGTKWARPYLLGRGDRRVLCWENKAGMGSILSACP